MAFPTTPILDDLITTSGLSANWTTPTMGIGNTVTQIHNVGARSSNLDSKAYWNAATFGGDSEVYATVTVLPTSGKNMGLWCRVTNPGTTTSPNLNAYACFFEPSASKLEIYGIVNNTFSGALRTVSQALSVGDSFGMSVIGTTLQLYYKASGGSWAAIGATVTDSTVTGTGRVAIECPDTTGVFQNFGGGTVVVAPTNSVAPVASGSTTVGSTVSVTDGTWTGAPTFTYQWQRDVLGNGVYSNIATATASSYTLTILDDACNVRCVVTGTNAGGAASANSNSILDTTPAGPPAGMLLPLMGVG